MSFVELASRPNGWEKLHFQIGIVACIVVVLVASVTWLALSKSSGKQDSRLTSFFKFFYASFLKPHDKSKGLGQQHALESFYSAQAAVYDATRTRLLRGREDMLGLLAAQLKHKAAKNGSKDRGLVWVDVSNPKFRNVSSNKCK